MTVALLFVYFQIVFMQIVKDMLMGFNPRLTDEDKEALNALIGKHNTHSCLYRKPLTSLYEHVECTSIFFDLAFEI